MFKPKVYAVAFAILLGGGQAQAASGYTFVGLDGADSTAAGINDLNQVAGTTALNAGSAYGHGVMWDHGKTRLFQDEGGDTYFSGGGRINNAGQVAGAFSYNGSIPSAAIWNYAAYSDPRSHADGGTASFATDINHSGQAVGAASTVWWLEPANYHAVRWDHGTETDLGALTGPQFNFSVASGINGKGDAVGYAGTDTGWGTATGTRPILWSDNKAIVLGGANGPEGRATDINDAGQVVGFMAAGANQHATLWSNGQATDLGTLGGASSYASAINGAGQVVGWSLTSSGASHAVLWANGQAIDLNTLAPSGWTLQQATDINRWGSIVGNAVDANGVQRAFMLVSPVPEADTYAMMLGGFAMLGLMRRRAKARQSA